MRHIYVLLLSVVLLQTARAQHTIDELVEYLNGGEYEAIASETCYKQNDAEWNYNTDITEENSNILTLVTMENAQIEKEIYDEWFKGINLDDIEDESVKRQVKFLQNIGNAALNDEDLKNVTDINNKMNEIYSTGKICPYDNQNCNIETEGLNLEPEIEAILAKSRDFEELSYVWKAWRDATGKQIRPYYKGYVELSNKAAVANNFADKGEMWRSDYESDTFIEDLDKLWGQVEPLYNKLHSYVRIKLINIYGINNIGIEGLIPANVLGNMWAQSWVNLADIARPYPEESAVNVTQELVNQGYSVVDMFETSNEFYMSLGLPTNEVSYGDDSMITKPDGKSVLCHASAWDFCDKKTYRIKMCTEVNSEDFITIHHEMGHIQYYLQYKDQPIAFRTGANPGFHEAVGDTIALSVATPKHLEKIGLLKNYTDTDEASLNALMDMALERLAFLPFGLLIDKWRWDVFANNVTEDKWNAHWWEYREKYQKLKPPVERSEIDLDPAAKFHVAGDSQYINYFVAHILEFQMYRGLCIAAGEYDPVTKSPPLHKCDFFQNKDAGDKLHAGLALGASKHWKEALIAMTGEDDLDAGAILDYFQPLSDYLDEFNSKM